MSRARQKRSLSKRAPGKRSAVKSARPPRMLAARRGGKRQSAAKPAPRKQTFVVNHLDANTFEEGLRAYAKYRNLDFAAATNGLARPHVIKMIPPCDPAVVSKRHYHDVDFKMIDVLKGWIRGEYEGAGVVTMRDGYCWPQPPRIKHSVLDYSADCELLEIILPADFKTVELE